MLLGVVAAACMLASIVAPAALAKEVIIPGVPVMAGLPSTSGAAGSGLSPQEKLAMLPPSIPGVKSAGGPFVLPSAGGGLPGVPSYLWRHGCGPTAAGMVIGYWDAHGWGDLVPGSAGSQGSAVNDMIANTAHYNDYSLPIDSGSSILDDKSTLGGAHTSNCVADFQHTSWSVDGLAYGWTYATTSIFATYGISYGMKAYTQLMNGAYGATVKTEYWAGNIESAWTKLKAEIDAGYPVVLLVDSDGDGYTDHFICAVGYDDSTGTKKYICYNTWDSSLHTYTFQAVASGKTWGVAYGSTYRPAGSTAIYSISGTITSGGSGLSGVTVSAG